jgi:hypothetical protein
MTELEEAAISAVREATLAMNVALRVAHEAGFDVEIEVLDFQTVSDRYPAHMIAGHCKKVAYEINQPF